jgi:hypothetical protein
MNPEIWASSGNNTNVAEAAHALANREGKQLKLLTAIIRYFLVQIILINLIFYFIN